MGFEMIEFASVEKIINENQAVRAAAESGNFTDFIELSKLACDTLPKEINAVYDAITADKSAIGVVCTSTHWYIATILQRKLGIYGMSMLMSPFFPTSDFPPYMVDTLDPATWQSLGPPFDAMTEPPVGAYVELWSAMFNSMIEMSLPAFKQAKEGRQLLDVDGLLQSVGSRAVSRSPLPSPRVRTSESDCRACFTVPSVPPRARVVNISAICSLGYKS